MTWKEFRKFATGLTKLWQLRLMALLLGIQPAKSANDTRSRLDAHLKAQPQDEEAQIAVTQDLLDMLLQLATPAKAAKEELPKDEKVPAQERPTRTQQLVAWLKTN